MLRYCVCRYDCKNKVFPSIAFKMGICHSKPVFASFVIGIESHSQLLLSSPVAPVGACKPFPMVRDSQLDYPARLCTRIQPVITLTNEFVLQLNTTVCRCKLTSIMSSDILLDTHESHILAIGKDIDWHRSIITQSQDYLYRMRGPD